MQGTVVLAAWFAGRAPVPVPASPISWHTVLHPRPATTAQPQRTEVSQALRCGVFGWSGLNIGGGRCALGFPALGWATCHPPGIGQSLCLASPQTVKSCLEGTVEDQGAQPPTPEPITVLMHIPRCCSRSRANSCQGVRTPCNYSPLGASAPRPGLRLRLGRCLTLPSDPYEHPYPNPKPSVLLLFWAEAVAERLLCSGKRHPDRNP